MATSTGKAARRQHGTRVAAKQAKRHRGKRRHFDSLPVSVKAGNALSFRAAQCQEGWVLAGLARPRVARTLQG